MMILDKDGFIRRAVPNMVLKKDARGNWSEVQEGYKAEGIALMRVIMFDSDRPNPALDAIRATGLLIEED